MPTGQRNAGRYMDVAGPFQIFVRAAELFVQECPGRNAPYNVLLASTTRRRPVATNCGLVLTGTKTFRTLRGPIDTVLVAGRSGMETPAHDEALLLRLHNAAHRAR